MTPESGHNAWSFAGQCATRPLGNHASADIRSLLDVSFQRVSQILSNQRKVTAIDPEAQTLTAITPDGRQLHMGADDIGADRLGYGYAITGHHAQGATVEVAHVLDDGGGRELA